MPFLANFSLVLSLKVEEQEIEIKETEAEVARWREACELEVEAAKVEMGERDKLVKNPCFLAFAICLGIFISQRFTFFFFFFWVLQHNF